MANVIIPRCKVHNDSSIDISSDGSLLAAFLPTTFNSPMDVELQVISLRTESFLNCIYSRKFGMHTFTQNKCVFFYKLL